MLRLFIVLSVACCGVVGQPQASAAGGWSGRDGEALRAHFKRGYTLNKLWSRMGER